MTSHVCSECLSQLTGTYTLDPAHSRIGFTARHAMVTKVRGAFNDFLAMEQYPDITFVSTGVKEAGENEFALTGDLTIKGVTNSITIPVTFEGIATDPFGNVRAGFEGSVAIGRADYGVTWNAALETGGVLVSDKIVLEFEISAIKNA